MAVGDEWEVFRYEIQMVQELKLYLTPAVREKLPWELQNSTVESAVLHTRILCDIVLSRLQKPDDITLEKLLTFSSPRIALVRDVYGCDRPKEEGTPYWQFNKKLAHPTAHRDRGHDYGPALIAVWSELDPLLQEIVTVRPT